MPRKKIELDRVRFTVNLKTEVMNHLTEQAQADAESCSLQYIDTGNLVASLLEVLVSVDFFKLMAADAAEYRLSLPAALRLLFEGDEFRKLCQVANEESDVSITDLLVETLQAGFAEVLPRYQARAIQNSQRRSAKSASELDSRTLAKTVGAKQAGVKVKGEGKTTKAPAQTTEGPEIVSISSRSKVKS